MNAASLRKGIAPGLWLTCAVVVGWVVCFWPARIISGERGVWWMTIAAICCLIPGWIVVFLSMVAIVRNEMVIIMLQTMIRLFTASVVAIAVRKLRPELTFADFFGWLIGFYILTLGCEVVLLRRQARHSGSLTGR